MPPKDESPKVLAIRLHDEEKAASWLRIEEVRADLAHVRAQHELFQIYGRSRRQSPAPGHVILVLNHRAQSIVQLCNRTIIRLEQVCQVRPGERHWCQYQDTNPRRKRRRAAVLYPLVDCKKALISLQDQFKELNAWHRAKFGW